LSLSTYSKVIILQACTSSIISLRISKLLPSRWAQTNLS